MLGDDGGDVLGGRDVEGGVLDGGAVGGHLLAVGVGDLGGGTLLDGDLIAVFRGDIDRREGRGYVEGDAVLFGEDGYGVGADLVGGIAVGCDAVGSYDDGLDLALTHEGAGHVVAEDSGGDVVVEELPGGEAGALQVGAGLVGVDVDLVAALDCGADDSEGCAVAAGGEGSRVAVGEDGAFLREEGCAVRSHGFAGGDVFVVHLLGFGDEGCLDVGDRGAGCGEGVVAVAHALDGPEQVDGGWAGLGEGLADGGDFGVEAGDIGSGALAYAERYAHRGGDSDCWCAADDHVADDGGDLLVVSCEDVGLFEGELGLVEEVNAVGEPF